MVSEPRSNPLQIFDRARIYRARARSAAGFKVFDFLHVRAMDDIIDRLAAVTRTFDRALAYGASGLAAALMERCKVGAVVLADLAEGRIGAGPPAAAADAALSICEPRVVFDEERSPLAPESFDLIVSALTLHAANDVVGALAQWRATLKPDGLFLAALFGEGTLKELRQAFYVAETQLSGGVSPRIAPFAGVRDLGNALQRAGFALPVADVDSVAVRYADPMKLLRDLRGMGEAGALAARGPPLTRRLLAMALENFADLGGVATFDIVYLTGWAPHPAQPKPLKPGSAAASLAAAVKSALSDQ